MKVLQKRKSASKRQRTYVLGFINDSGEIGYRELALPEFRQDQVLVRIHYCAICTLEQRIYSGVIKLYPFACGHEVSGVVEAVGEKVTSVRPGDKVAVQLLSACGECNYCRASHENHCVVSFRTSMHEGLRGPGGFSQYIVTGANSVYRLDENVNLVHASLTEPLACCVHSVRNANICLGEDVVIIGTGFVGALHVQLAKMSGARVIVCEVDKGRLEMATRLGADVTVNSLTENALEKVRDLTQGRGADVVFCTSAVSRIAEESIEMAGKLGRVVLCSSFHPGLPAEFDVNKVHSHETVITGSANPGTRDFLTATRMLSYNLIDVSHLISEIYPLSEADAAFKMAIKPETYRVVVNCV